MVLDYNVLNLNNCSAFHYQGAASNQSFDVQFANWRMESIANDDASSSNEEFYDAEGMSLKESDKT